MTPVVSQFRPNNADGWTTCNGDLSDDATGPIRIASRNGQTWLAATDIQNGKNWGWWAPAKFRGHHADKFGKLLTYSLWTSACDGDHTAAPFVVLRAAESTVILTGANLSPPKPGDPWTVYRVRLDPSAGWVRQGSREPATAGDIRRVLADLQGMWIKGEFSNTRDTGRLTDVSFGAEK